MTKEERKQQIKEAYRIVSNSRVHKEYAERLKFFYGWSGQFIASKLKRVCTYLVDNPDCNLGEVYGDVMGLNNKDGQRYPDLTI